MFGKGDPSPDSGDSRQTPGPSGSSVTSGGFSANKAPAGGGSVISSDLKVVGNLESTGDIEIDGSVEGDIKSRSVTVGASANIKGTVDSESMVIHGTVSGQVRGDLVRIMGSATVTGNIAYQTLSVEEGAAVEGEIRRKDSHKGAGAGAGDTKVAPIKTGTDSD